MDNKFTRSENMFENVPYLDESLSTVRDWLKVQANNHLTAKDFRSYWKQRVPVIYSLKPNCDCLNINYDEDLAHKVLFLPLERFIIGNENENDPLSAFDGLKTTEQPSTLCGRVFKKGEPTYSCRDCLMDPTCVLCINCFKNSEHRNHRYKMNSSGGGGYCDCGDLEAWKDSPFCSIHKPNNSSEKASHDPVNILPENMVCRINLVFRTILSYCIQLLTWENSLTLPSDLKCEESDDITPSDSFATMMYNDEVHTYDQVIQSLVRAISCSNKDAMDFATIVDREGRSLIKFSSIAQCEKVEESIRRHTLRGSIKPLKVSVMHTSVIAHQTFALRLLQWLQKVLSYSEAFRRIFNDIMLEADPNEPSDSEAYESILEKVMSKDSQLWKSARMQWHQLFISGMLMDHHCKRAFSKVFTKNYPLLVKDYIADDHEHSLSITSLSVQIFTVPTVAHMLILEENAMAALLNAFLSECHQKRNKDSGKLSFGKTDQGHSFRRSHFILNDLKYLLLSKPNEWDLKLRRNYLHGLSSVLTLMSWMQGMDSVVRQVGQHMEFEPEWENGFNLHIRLAPVIDLMLQWCGSDRVVLTKAFRACLKCIQSMESDVAFNSRELCGHSVYCINYDVKTQAVTIHLPVTRFLAGLFLHLQKFGLHHNSEEFDFQEKPSIEVLFELPLRTLVMIGQVRAGMWRRNGYSILNQIYFYHNVRCRSEMFDLDIVMMQTAACIIEPNRYLIHLLNKYNLLKWAKDDYIMNKTASIEESSLRFMTTLIDELLHLLIIIISERHMAGIGFCNEEDRVKKEIIQLLCIEPMAHSELSRELPTDNSNETGLEDVIDEVADFKKPQESEKGTYELKPEYYKDFNPFFYHYSKEEQSKAEERQRKRRKLAGEEECCPPPVPLELSEFYFPMIHLLDCDVMIHIIKTVLSRVSCDKAQFFSESHFQKVLHLIGLALHEQERHYEMNKESFLFIDKSFNEGILNLLESLVSNEVIADHKDLLAWVIRKFKSVMVMKASRSENSLEVLMKDDVSMADAEDEKDFEKEKRAKLAADRRKKIMAHMSAMQKKFMKCHADLFTDSDGEESDSKEQQLVDKEPDSTVTLAFGSQIRVNAPEKVTCILCQETQEINVSNQAMVMTAYVQKSTVMSQSRLKVMEDTQSQDPLLLSSDLFCAPHLNTCGHVMHAECYQKIFDNIRAKESRPPIRFRQNISFDIKKQEILCPLCETITNATIPLMPSLGTFVSEAVSVSSEVTSIPFDDWLNILQIAVKQKSLITHVDADETTRKLYKSPSLSTLLQSLPSSTSNNIEQLYSLYKLSNFPELSSSYRSMMLNFSQVAYTIGLDLEPHSEDPRTVLMVWQTCAYTILSMEWLLRDQQKPLFGSSSMRQVDCLRAIVRFSFSLNLVAPVHIVQNHCLRMLSWLLGLEENYHSECQSILDVDMFTLLVSLSCCISTLFEQSDLVPISLANIVDLYILRLIYVAHVIQILVTSSFDTSESNMDSESSFKCHAEEEKALEWYKFVRKIGGAQMNAVEHPSGFEVLRVIKEGTLPFLRCAALLFHYVTEVPPLAELQEFGMDNEHAMLCHYLGLSPDLSQLTRSLKLQQLIQSWLQHDDIKNLFCGASSTNIVQYPLKVTQLVNLPEDYSELINEVSIFTCPNSDGDDSRTPAMCLVCGKVLCSQSYCCQIELDKGMIGACCHHSMACGVGNSIFLRVRDCKLLLRSGLTKGCFISPPYLDQYGETDPGLKRGNPLHLSKDKYKELHSLWLSHKIPETVSRTLEASSVILPVDWQNL